MDNMVNGEEEGVGKGEQESAGFPSEQLTVNREQGIAAAAWGL